MALPLDSMQMPMTPFDMLGAGALGPAGAPLGTIQTQPGITAVPPPRNTEGKTFGECLTQQQGLRFSSHASQRLSQRGMRIDAPSQARLSGAVDQAAAKGAKTSLVLMDGDAFVVSVPNRTVITALPSDAARGNVFTNIDSTVIA